MKTDYQGNVVEVEEGDECPVCGDGIVELSQEKCYCFACSNPPCSACESSSLRCSNCGDGHDDARQYLRSQLMY